MISPQEWLNSLMNSIELVADDISQENAWRDKYPLFFPDCAEIFCKVFDDSLLDDFLDGTFWRETSLNMEQHQLMCELRAHMRKAGKVLDHGFRQEMILNNTNWLKARSIAHELVSTVDYSKED